MNINKKTVAAIVASAISAAAIGYLILAKSNKKKKLLSTNDESLHNTSQHNRHPNRIKKWEMHHSSKML